MKKRLALIIALAAALALVGCMAAGFAGVSQKSFDITAGQSATFTGDPGMSFTSDDTRVATVSESPANSGNYTITTYALSPGWTGGTILRSSKGDIISVRTTGANYYPYNYNYYPYNNNYYSYPYNNYSYIYHCRSHGYFVPTCVDCIALYPNGYYNYANNYTPVVVPTVTRPSAEPILAAGQAKDAPGLANEIANTGSLYFDGDAANFTLFTSNNIYNISTDSARGASKATLKVLADQLTRMGRFGIDGLRLSAPNAPAALVLTPEADKRTNYNQFSIEGLSDDGHAHMCTVAITANSKTEDLILEFNLTSNEELYKNHFTVTMLKGAEEVPLDMGGAKLYRTASEDNNGNMTYGYRLSIPGIGAGTYTLDVR